MPSSQAAPVSRETPPATSSRTPDNAPVHAEGLTRKLTCSILSVQLTGVLLILSLQIGLILDAVPYWGQDSKATMIELEQDNLKNLASGKAEHVTENFWRLEEAVLQIQGFAKQALLEVPETMIVDDYIMGYPGLEQIATTWEHSVWFITEYAVGQVPPANSLLEDLLNRTSLLDVSFRAMQRQHLLIYVAALNDPSLAAGKVSNISMHPFAGFDMEEAGYLEHTLKSGCDARFEDYGGSYVPTTYDPRCRPWYQDAIENGNTGIIFTNPYSDAGSGLLTVTVAVPMYNPTDAKLLMGVVGIDMNFTDVKVSVNSLSLISDDDGYAYLLAPGGDGEVAVHRNLDASAGSQYIVDLEEGVDEEQFGGLVIRMSETCNGSDVYDRDGSSWILAWNHDTVSGVGASGSGDCGSGGFIAVVTVSESALLKEFSQIEEDTRNIVTVATTIMVVAVVVIGLVTAGVALMVSNGIVEPVNELIGFVQALSSMDFSKQPVGTWVINDVSCAEVGELMEAFQAMSTVVKFANTSLMSGKVELAKQNFLDALILFEKFGNDRAVAIVNNNLGTVLTLQAQELTLKASNMSRTQRARARKITMEADNLYSEAIEKYKLAIADADSAYTESRQTGQGSSTLLVDKQTEHKMKEGETLFPTSSVTTVAIFPSSDPALSLQLSNRKFNMTVCLAAKGNSANLTTTARDPNSITEVRELLLECIQLASESKYDKGDEWRVKYLLELAAIEGSVKRQQLAKEALDAAESIIATYRGTARELVEGSAHFGFTCVLYQRLLVARGAHLLDTGHINAAIDCWTSTIIGCGDRMDVTAVRSALEGLLRLANGQRDRIHLPSDLLMALGLPSMPHTELQQLASAISNAVAIVQRQEELVHIKAIGHSQKTMVDLCFLMDCTGSMQSWINQAKNKLTDIIKQTKEDVGELGLRVAFVGYRDFGDTVQYEGPYDFHEEEHLPSLLAKLQKIKANGGKDVPEDIAGGLKRAKALSWKSSVRLCVLIADAPCHGVAYHTDLHDRYPKGCPNGLDPTELLYELQYELRVDFYFIKITSYTDKMITVWREKASSIKTARAQFQRQSGGTKSTDPKFGVRNLGSNDNRFLEAVVSFLKVSLNLIIEE